MHSYKRDILNHQLTTHYLSLLEQGAHSKLSDFYLTEENPLPVDLQNIYRLIGVKTDAEKQAVASVLKDFFEQKESGWHNEEYDRQIMNYQARRKTNQRNASQPRKRNENESLTTPEPIVEELPANSKPVDSELLTDSYPIESDSLAGNFSIDFDAAYDLDEAAGEVTLNPIDTNKAPDAFDHLKDFINHSQTRDYQIDSDLLKEDLNLLANGYQIAFDPIATGYQMAYDPLLMVNYPYPNDSEPLADGKPADNDSYSLRQPVAHIHQQPQDDDGDKTVGQSGGVHEEKPDSIGALLDDLEETLEFLDQED